MINFKINNTHNTKNMSSNLWNFYNNNSQKLTNVITTIINKNTVPNDDLRNLLIRNIFNYIRLSPNTLLDQITNFNRNTSSNIDIYLNEWKLKIYCWFYLKQIRFLNQDEIDNDLNLLTNFLS